MMKLSLFLLASIAALVFGGAEAFVVQPSSFGAVRTSSTTTSLEMTVLSYNGKKKNFPAGSPLSKAVAALGIKPTYSLSAY